MDVITQILANIPEGWPRAVALLIVVALYALPTVVGQVSLHERQRRELEHLRRILEVRKLLAELETLARHHDIPEVTPRTEAERLRQLLRKQGVEAYDPPMRPFAVKLRPAFAGSMVIAALPILVVLSGSVHVSSFTVFVVREAVIVSIGTVVAALVPASRPRQSFMYGLLLPVAVALLSLIGHGPVMEPMP